MPKRNRFSFVLAAAAGAATAAAVAQYTIQKREAESRLRAGSAVIGTEHGPVECAVFGHGPAVLVSHGVYGGYDHAIAVARPLAEAGFTVIAVSRAGYLRTPLSTGARPEAQAEAHAAILEALGIERAAIVGVSGGGPSALWFAARHPERCCAVMMLCAVSDSHVFRSEEAAPPYRLLTSAAQSDVLMWSLVSGMRLAPSLLGALDPQLYQRVADHPSRRKMLEEVTQSMFPVSARRIGIENDLLRLRHLAPIPLEQISAPALVLHGENDSVVPVSHAEYAAAHIPNAALIKVGAGADHAFFVSHYDEVWPQAIAFLKAHTD